jgi:hypothetical protein
MTKKVAPVEDVEDVPPAAPAKRLCNEIQLFDLCDREKCDFKEGAYCTEPDLLRRFEAIADEEDRVPANRAGGADDDEEWEGEEDEYDDSFDDDRYDDDRFDEDE